VGTFLSQKGQLEGELRMLNREKGRTDEKGTFARKKEGKRHISLLGKGKVVQQEKKKLVTNGEGP